MVSHRMTSFPITALDEPLALGLCEYCVLFTDKTCRSVIWASSSRGQQECVYPALYCHPARRKLTISHEVFLYFEILKTKT